MNIINHPSVMLIIGRRRFGKSALGYYIEEKIHIEQPLLKIFVVSLPVEKHHLLPEWIHPVNDVEDLPDNCVALIDEGALKYHAHKWHKKETEVMDRLISISGQRHQTFIFITHTLRKFAVTLLLDINMLLVKKPSLLQMKLERSEFRKLIEKIDLEFRKIPKDEVKSSVYIVSDDFEGFIRNPLPSFWSEDLSEAYAGVKLKEEETEEKVSPLPFRIDNGLKIWFKKENIRVFLNILQRNSNVEGELSEYGVGCNAGNCHYDFDLVLGLEGKYHIAGGKYFFDVERTLKELEEQKISFVVDVESAYPLTKEDVVFKIEEKKILEKKDNLEEYGKKVKL